MKKYVEKYAVFTETKFNAVAELNISNKIIEREHKLNVLTIVRQWVNEWIKERLPNYDCCVYFKGNYEDATILDITMDSPKDPVSYALNVFQKKSNVRVQIGTYETTYETKRVYEKD